MSQNDKRTKLGPVESYASVTLLGVVSDGTYMYSTISSVCSATESSDMSIYRKARPITSQLSQVISALMLKNLFCWALNII